MAAMMTPRQREQVFTLLREVHGDAAREQFEKLRESHPNPTREEASALISDLIAQKRKKPSKSAPAVPSGHYALRDGNGVQFYRVDKPDTGKWAGRIFVSKIAGDNEHPVKGERGRLVLEKLAEDPMAASVLYGQELGVCGVCSRTLTNEESRAFGIGPTCRTKF